MLSAILKLNYHRHSREIIIKFNHTVAASAIIICFRIKEDEYKKWCAAKSFFDPFLKTPLPPPSLRSKKQQYQIKTREMSGLELKISVTDPYLHGSLSFFEAGSDSASEQKAGLNTHQSQKADPDPHHSYDSKANFNSVKVFRRLLDVIEVIGGGGGY
jgi:hypothetical protein